MATISFVRVDSNTSVGTNSITSGSFSPSDGQLIYFTYATRSSTAGITITPSTTLSNVGAWSTYKHEFDNGTVKSYIFKGWALITGAPGTGTITILQSGNSTDKVLQIYTVTDPNTSTPVHATNRVAGDSTTNALSLTLPNSPASDSIVVGAVNSLSSTGNIAPGSAFSELHEDAAGSVDLETEVDTTSPGTTVDWSNLNTAGNVGIAVEIPAAGGGTTPVSRDFEMRWNVAAEVSKDLEFRWNVFEEAWIDLPFRWNVDAEIFRDFPFRWHVFGEAPPPPAQSGDSAVRRRRRFWSY